MLLSSEELELSSTFELPLGMGMWGESVSIATASDLSRGISSTWGHISSLSSFDVFVILVGFVCVIYDDR